MSNTIEVFSKKQQILKEIAWGNGILPASYVIDDGLVVATNSTMLIANEICKYLALYPEAYVSQQTIADNLGIHHDTVNRSLKSLSAMNYIDKKYRGANSTCLYSLGSVLRNSQALWMLRDVLPNAFWAFNKVVDRAKKSLGYLIQSLSTGMLISKPAVKIQNTARLSNDKNIYTNTKISSSKQIQNTQLKQEFPKINRDDTEYIKRQQRDSSEHDRFQQMFANGW